MKTTIFLFHPNLKESRANAALIKDTDIEVRDIYTLYPDGNIDVKAEQNALTKTDRIGLKSIFETGFKRHSEPRLPSTAQINH
ncbi:Glutathione-regulated potassium-efflux system ancillary protein KefF [Companilactobacillus paralimentarius]|uniref:hypothetical protein n=1 Tax=Companilactobacillus paralimentarius TaxID=83526 RepID=UPI00384C8542